MSNSVHSADAPALYVGTYCKYSEGSLFGAWLYLEDYADADEFMKACRELHKDEAYPELMFQDYENFPRSLYSESAGVDNIAAIYEWMELDKDEREMLDAYESIHGEGDGSITDRARKASEAYFCTVDDAFCDWEDVAWEYVHQGCFGIDIPENLQYYFCWATLGRELHDSMSMADNGMVFWD